MSSPFYSTLISAPTYSPAPFGPSYGGPTTTYATAAYPYYPPSRAYPTGSTLPVTPAPLLGVTPSAFAYSAAPPLGNPWSGMNIPLTCSPSLLLTGLTPVGPTSAPSSVYAEVALSRLNQWAKDNSYAIGKTALVRLHKVAKGCGATVLAKVEGRNPAYSVKCRIGASMIWDAEHKGLLKPGMTIVEPTSGNTGIALAYVGAARGYEVLLTIPETMSVERRKVMKAFGAKLILTEGAKGMKGAIAKAEEIAGSDPKKYYMPQQFKNAANPLVHELTTGPEIWEATNGLVDVLVSGVGTGGTITGISRFWKPKRPLLSVAVEPIHSPVLTQKRKGEELKPGPHKIQGIGAGFVPDVLDMSLVDEIETVSQDEAIAMGRRLAAEEGILSGISCGAAVHVAVKLAQQERFKGKTIVVILPDAGERYLSSVLFDSEEYKALDTAKAGPDIL